MGKCALPRVVLTAFVIGTLTHAPGWANETGPSAVSITPEPKIQAQIRRVVDMLEDGGVAAASPELERLVDIAGDGSQLVEQVAWFFVDSRDENVMLAHFIFHPCLPLDIDDRAIVRGLAPFLDSHISEFVEDAFTAIDGITSRGLRSELSPPAYGAYRHFIESNFKRSEPVPDTFVSFIYRRDPAAALLAYVYAHEDAVVRYRDVLWSQHVISDAIWRKEKHFEERFEQIRPDAVRELEELSGHEAFWIRLYAAEIVQQHPELSTQEITQRLQSDEHNLVRRAMLDRRQQVPERPVPPQFDRDTIEKPTGLPPSEPDENIPQPPEAELPASEPSRSVTGELP